jgi:hypothetical protein
MYSRKGLHVSQTNIMEARVEGMQSKFPLVLSFDTSLIVSARFLYFFMSLSSTFYVKSLKGCASVHGDVKSNNFLTTTEKQAKGCYELKLEQKLPTTIPLEHSRGPSLEEPLKLHVSGNT